MSGNDRIDSRLFRAVETQCLTPSYLRALCRYAQPFGAGAVVAMTGEWDQQTLFDYRQWVFKRQKWEYDFARRKRRALAEACRIVHGHGMQFFCWRHELQMHPEHIRKLNPALLDYAYGRGRKAGAWGQSVVDVDLGFFDPRKRPLWDYIRWRFEHLFELFGDLDGVFLTCLTETKLPLWNLCKEMGRTEIMTRLLDVAVRACRRHGKQLIVRNWGAYRNPHDPQGQVLYDALDAIGAPADVWIMEKSIEPDFALGYPPNAAIAAGAKRRGTLMELELAGETEGGSTVPACLPHEVQAAIQHGRRCGCKGFVARVDSWPDTIQWTRTYHTLGTPNEINLYSCLRLMQDGDVPVEQIWRDWAGGRFGDAAQAVIDLLRPTFDAALGTYTCGGSIMNGSEHMRPTWVLNNLTGYARYLYTRLPADKRWMDALADPGEADVRALVDEKRRARDVYRKGLLQVKALQSRLPARWYASLRDAFTHAAEIAEYLALYTEGLFGAVGWRKNGRDADRRRARAALARGRTWIAAAALPNARLTLRPKGLRPALRQSLDQIEPMLTEAKA